MLAVGEGLKDGAAFAADGVDLVRQIDGILIGHDLVGGAGLNEHGRDNRG